MLLMHQYGCMHVLGDTVLLRVARWLKGLTGGKNSSFAGTVLLFPQCSMH
jgi:hypothetical protein